MSELHSPEILIATTPQHRDDAFAVRISVFVDEQGISRDDELDDLDATAIHCVAYADSTPVGAGRLVVMDGYGLPKTDVGSAIAAARKPNLDRLFAECPNIRLRAHGTAVGMPSDEDMGNSEVGHNALGAGQVYAQGAALVSDAIAAGTIWQGRAWQEVVAGAKSGRGVIHFMGLFSDGNVHSHIDHLKAMVAQARAEGVKTVRIHALLDGRDVPETSALDYVLPFEAFLKELSSGGFDARIASGGGRQCITMDRYEANWAMVGRGWRTHVLGEGPQFPDAASAVRGLREMHPGTIDQDLPPFVIAADGKPVGTVEDGDAVVFFNFRADRVREIEQDVAREVVRLALAALRVALVEGGADGRVHDGILHVQLAGLHGHHLGFLVLPFLVEGLVLLH